jgi:AraC-like DNA-binding protein
MSFDAAPLYEWKRIFHSHDVEQIRAFLSEEIGKKFWFAHRPRERPGLRIEGIDLASIGIRHIWWHAPVAVESSRPDPEYVVALPIRGRFEVSIGASVVAGDPHHAVIYSRPTVPASLIRMEAGTGRLNLKLPHTMVMRQLAGLLGEPIDTSLEFAPAMDLRGGYGQSFARYLRLAVTDFSRPGPIPWSPITIGRFEDFIISKLLLAHAHNYSKALRRADKRIAPRDIKRALDFIGAKLASPITIADVAEASGIAGRTLFKHFRDYHGISPFRFLRNARFQKVRETLTHAQPEDSVTAIAMSWGFSHMGRFSVEYRKRYGESPSETLGRRHRR